MKSNLKTIVDVKAVEKNIAELGEDLKDKSLNKKDKKILSNELASLIEKLEGLGNK